MSKQLFRIIETLDGNESEVYDIEAENMEEARTITEGYAPENSGFEWESLGEDFSDGLFEIVDPDDEDERVVEGTLSVERL